MIYIFGDSFVDDNFGYSGSTIPWYNRFGSNKNYAKSGTGPHYAFKQFYKKKSDFNENDIVIFCLSTWERIDWLDRHDRENQFRISYHIDKNLVKYWNHDSKNHQNIQFFYNTISEELQYTDNKNICYLYMLSKKMKFRVFLLFGFPNSFREDYSYLNNERFHIFNTPLWEITGPGGDRDHRLNHFTDKNHDVMQEYFSDFLFYDLDDTIKNYDWEYLVGQQEGFIYE